MHYMNVQVVNCKSPKKPNFRESVLVVSVLFVASVSHNCARSLATLITGFV